MLFAVFVGLAETGSLSYRVTRALIGAAFGALGGGLAALLVYAVQKRFSKAALSIGALLGFIASEVVMQGAQFVVDSVYETAVKPTVDRAILERSLVTGPQLSLFRWLRAHDPERFAQIMDDVALGVQKGESSETTINRVRAKFIEPMVAANAPYMDDQAMGRYVDLIANQLDAFSLGKPELCVRILRGQPLGDIRPYLSASLAAAEVQLLDDAVKVDKRANLPRSSAAERDRLVGAAVARMPAEIAKSLALLAPDANVVGKEKLVCQVGASYFRAIAVLGAARAGALMRSLLASGKR